MPSLPSIVRRGADDLRAQLVQFDGVLVWVNPIHEGRTALRA